MRKFKSTLKNQITEALTALAMLIAFVGIVVLLIMIVFSNRSLHSAYPSSCNITVAPTVYASGAILVDESDGRVLFEKGADKKLYPASTTKIMTALVTLSTCEKLRLGIESEVLVPKDAAGTEGSSIYLKEGERITIEKLLYGLLLESGNDAAETLAICMGGNRDAFIKMMNETAKELGCENTNFTNPSGLFDENHYTTARDLALIAEAAMKKDNFKQIVSTKTWGDYGNKNKTLFQYEGGNGVKIGFTKASGRTLVAGAKRGSDQLIAVVLRDSNWFQDAYAMMDFGFNILKEGRGG